NPDFVNVIQETVKIARDVAYTGSLFANFFFLYLLDNQQSLPPITHDLCYSVFALIAGQGSNAPPLMKTVYSVFKESVPSYAPEKFHCEGLMSLISTEAKQYEENIRNHITANFRGKTIQYLLIVVSDEEDEWCIRSLKVSERKVLVEYIYEKVAGSDPSWPKALPDEPALRSKAETIQKSMTSIFGDNAIDDKKLNAEPHLYIPWMFHILQRMEAKVFVTEEKPQKYVSTAYVHRKVKETNYVILSEVFISHSRTTEKEDRFGDDMWGVKLSLFENEGPMRPPDRDNYA
ncbi:hypothetical protein DFQ28_002815, partial [Apophysomyces sp. BC1034]